MTTTLFFLQDIDRSLEVIVRSNSSWVYDNHTALNFSLINTTKEKTYVITSLTLCEVLTEHLNTSDYRLLVLTKTEQLNFITYLTYTSLNTTSSNSTTTCDREYILNRHQEWLINLTLWFLNPSINSVHELHYRIYPLLYAVQSTKCRTTNNWSILLVTILLKNLVNFHFNEVKHFLIVNHIALVQENNQTRYVYLTSEQYVLTSLWHRTISSSYNQDSTIHLCSTSNHVLYIVSVTRTVYVCIVTFSCFVLNMSRVNGDTTLFLFRSIINLIERLNILRTKALLMKNL